VNPQESLVTPVPNPELILKKGKSFQGQTSKSSTQENSIISYQEEEVIAEEVIGSNLVEESPKILEINHSSSSLESFHS
jgi:hypothetical protein